eukprot:scaffold408_cov71-Cylindrotheca_fusiformis.AAC.36
MEREKDPKIPEFPSTRQQCATTTSTATATITTHRTSSWEPTQAEVGAWDEQIVPDFVSNQQTTSKQQQYIFGFGLDGGRHLPVESREHLHG